MKKQKAKSAREVKVETIKSLAEKVSRAKTMTFANYHGLTVNQLGQLRAKIKEAGGEFLVTKNSLMSRALQSSKLTLPTSGQAVDSSPASRGKQFTGPTATIFAYEDEIAPIKTAAETAKTLGTPQFKFGFFGKDFLDMAAVEALSKIPSRPELHAKVVGALSSPLYGIVGVLQANIRNLVSILDQVSKKA